MSTILSPEQFLDEIEPALPISSPAERARLLEHADAWATVRFEGVVPVSVQARLQRMRESSLQHLALERKEAH